MKPQLVKVKCPHCRATEVFLASEVGKQVSCQRDLTERYKLPAGTAFGATDWDASTTPGQLRECLKLHTFTPRPWINSAFAVALARAVYPKLGNMWLRKAVAFAEKFQETGKAPIEEVE